MIDYTVIVDDNDGRIIYQPGDSWSSVNDTRAYQRTFHRAMSMDANLTLSFVGGSYSDCHRVHAI